MSSISRKRSTKGFALLLLGGLLLTGCGTSAQPSATSAKQGNKGSVALVYVNRTAQVLAAAPGKSSSVNEAVFTLTANDAQGNPVKNAKVSFLIGQMKPLGSMMPMTWYTAGTSGANPFVAHYSKRTNASGQATLTLFGQPSGTMEMIGVKVGSLSSFGAKGTAPSGMLDAWWTSSNSGEASAGNYVAVTPFMASGISAKNENVTVAVMGSSGPILGASVKYTVETPGTGGMGNPVSTDAKGLSTNMQGHVMLPIMLNNAGDTSVRIVVTRPGSTNRVAGGLSILLSR